MNVHEHEQFELYAIDALMKVGHSQASAAGVFSSWVAPKNVALKPVEPSAVVKYVKPSTEKPPDVKTMIRLAMTGKMGLRAKQTAQRVLDMKRAFIVASIKAQQEAKKEL